MKHCLCLLVAIGILLAGCAAPVPKSQSNICKVFRQEPDWYDYARASAKRWGTPVHILMAFVRHESSYRSDARPPYRWFMLIPLGRPSSARGYAQAVDSVWSEYRRERGGFFRSREDMEDALDFVGWYNHKSWKELKIKKTDARNLYLAYHEGRGGYRRGTWKRKTKLKRIAQGVANTAAAYKRQLKSCESRFRCDSWYQIWPFCS